MAQDAGHMALQELSMGRTAMILFPSVRWNANMFDMGRPPEGIFLRVANRHTELRYIPIDTLILVAADDDDWDQVGLALAKEKLHGAIKPVLVSISRNHEDAMIQEGAAIWE